MISFEDNWRITWKNTKTVVCVVFLLLLIGLLLAASAQQKKSSVIEQTKQNHSVQWKISFHSWTCGVLCYRFSRFCSSYLVPEYPSVSFSFSSTWTWNFLQPLPGKGSHNNPSHENVESLAAYQVVFVEPPSDFSRSTIDSRLIGLSLGSACSSRMANDYDLFGSIFRSNFRLSHCLACDNTHS